MKNYKITRNTPNEPFNAGIPLKTTEFIVKAPFGRQ